MIHETSTLAIAVFLAFVALTLGMMAAPYLLMI